MMSKSYSCTLHLVIVLAGKIGTVAAFRQTE